MNHLVATSQLISGHCTYCNYDATKMYYNVSTVTTYIAGMTQCLLKVNRTIRDRFSQYQTKLNVCKN